MLVKEFSKETRRIMRKHFSRYGTILECAKATGLDRGTIARARKNMEASGEVVDKITNYLNRNR